MNKVNNEEKTFTEVTGIIKDLDKKLCKEVSLPIEILETIAKTTDKEIDRAFARLSFYYVLYMFFEEGRAPLTVPMGEILDRYESVMSSDKKSLVTIKIINTMNYVVNN